MAFPTRIRMDGANSSYYNTRQRCVLAGHLLSATRMRVLASSNPKRKITNAC